MGLWSWGLRGESCLENFHKVLTSNTTLLDTVVAYDEIQKDLDCIERWPALGTNAHGWILKTRYTGFFLHLYK